MGQGQWDGYTTVTRLTKLFPKLKTAPNAFKRTSPEDRFYNCVAWAMNDDQRWWEPLDTNFPLTYWPIERKGYRVEAYAEMFESQGYTRCDSGTVEPDFERIVIYAAKGEFKHVSRQTAEPQGWLSKCGPLSDIWHATPEHLESADYGKVWGFMKRPKDRGGAGR